MDSRLRLAEEQSEYLHLFENFPIKNYAKRFAEYFGQSFELRGTRPESGEKLLGANVGKQPNDGDLATGWSPNGGGYRMLDVRIEGNQHDGDARFEFASIIQSKGGKVAGLIELLRSGYRQTLVDILQIKTGATI